MLTWSNKFLSYTCYVLCRFKENVKAFFSGGMKVLYVLAVELFSSSSIQGAFIEWEREGEENQNLSTATLPDRNLSTEQNQIFHDSVSMKLGKIFWYFHTIKFLLWTYSKENRRMCF